MAYPFLLLGAVLLVLLLVLHRLLHLHTVAFKQAMWGSRYREATQMAPRGTVYFGAYVTAMGALAWWIWRALELVRVLA